jgi:hypothetical protein
MFSNENWIRIINKRPSVKVFRLHYEMFLNKFLKAAPITANFNFNRIARSSRTEPNMQNLRRALALLSHHNDISFLTSGFSRQQTAAMATKITKTESGSGDSKLQLMMKALEPQAAEDVTMTPEELAEAEKRSVFISNSPLYRILSLYPRMQ